MSLCQQKHMIWRTLFVFDHFFLLFFSSFFQNDFHRIGLRARHVYRLNKPQSYSHTKPNQTKPSQAKSRERHNIVFEIERISDFYITNEHIWFMCGLFTKRFVQEHFWNFNGWNEFDWACPVQKLIEKRTEMCEWYICYSIFLIFAIFIAFHLSDVWCVFFFLAVAVVVALGVCSFVNRLVVGYAHNFHK